LTAKTPRRQGRKKRGELDSGLKSFLKNISPWRIFLTWRLGALAVHPLILRSPDEAISPEPGYDNCPTDAERNLR
jgi:hypothetical protein